jgi:hypothetical protein
VQAEKPHKGRIHSWVKMQIGDDYGLGWCAYGRAEDHPDFGNHHIRTSYVVKHDEATGEVETRNSRYTLVGPEKT